MASGLFPRTSDLVYCNGLLALRDGSFRECIGLLGIACEIELAECLEALLATRSDAVARLLYERTRPDFKWKLKDLLPALCGRTFTQEQPDWAKHLFELYQARGAATHSAITAETWNKIPPFVLAADAFLRWSHQIRSAHGEVVGPCPLSITATLGPGP